MPAWPVDRGCQEARIPTRREPTHPGEMLLEEFLEPMGMTQRELADRIRVPCQRIDELVNRRRGITPSLTS
jgi:addiction module HigA family antidote